MKLFTDAQYNKLINNGAEANRDADLWPVVKLFLPGTGCAWLLTDVDPEVPDIAFGLCDLGLGFPEMGSVSIQELMALNTAFGAVERDLHFEAKYPISVYSRAARLQQFITFQEELLQQASVDSPTAAPPFPTML